MSEQDRADIDECVSVYSGRVDAHLQSHLNRIYVNTDRLFGWLMVIQFVAGIATAFWVSPYTWSGTEHQTHTHIYAAVFLGGLIVSLPILLAWTQAGKPITRHVIAIAQALMSALLIHLSGGRIETHFHIFGSLALLAFYRDWRVLVTASTVITLDHFLRGLYWPESVFGVGSASAWRWLEHALWVVVEDVFLIRSCIQGVYELHSIAEQRVDLELANEAVEKEIAIRTAELQQREAELSAILYAAADGVVIVDEFARIHSMNRTAELLFGESSQAAEGRSLSQFIQRGEAVTEIADIQRVADADSVAYTTELLGVRSNKETFPLEATVTSVEQTNQRPLFIWATRDVTARKQSEAAQSELQQQRIETARLAGMSQIATGVLHNVGNALNSVNVSASLMQGYLDSSKLRRVKDVAELFGKHQNKLDEFLINDQRGQRIPQYIGALGDQLEAEQSLHKDELTRLVCQIDYIKRIIGTQQTIAGSAELVETIDIAETIDDTVTSIGMNESGKRISVVREYVQLPPVTVDRPRFVQILFNLIRNAKESILEQQPEEPTLRLRVQAGVETGEFEITVTDNGVGIEPDLLKKIFTHGFSTKPGGHGFSLHSSANAATEMGGSLSVSSSGPGGGATFRLSLPLRNESMALPVGAMNPGGAT